MRKQFTLFIGAVLVASTAVVGVLSPQTASAASSPCGASYTEYTSTGTTRANLVAYRSSDKRTICVVNHVTWVARAFGINKNIYTSASIVKNGVARRDVGYYQYYAGPVYMYMPNGCASFSGSVRLDSGYSETQAGWVCNGA